MNPADLALSNSPTLSSKPLPTPTSAVPQKNGKIPVPRVENEQIYTQLKTALGEDWEGYKAAISAFVLGNLNQNELSFVLGPLLGSTAAAATTSATPAAASPVSVVQLHNTLVASVFANIQRDSPPSEVAPWVVNTDKPTSAVKNAGTVGANDKADERLKREVMALQARDRRRIKSLKVDATMKYEAAPLTDMMDYRYALSVKPPDVAPPSAGGLAKTNWDLEIRRKYAQPLAAETLEFPSQAEVQSRIEPICYEEGLVGGVTQGALQNIAELLEQAVEVRFKEILDEFAMHTRSDGQGCIQTAKFRRQMRKEEEDAERGIVQRNTAGLLPIELDMQAKREPFGRDDLRLARELDDVYLKQDRFLSTKIQLGRWSEEQNAHGQMNGRLLNGGPVQQVNGTADDNEDAMAVDDDEWKWQGGTRADQDMLFDVLTDVLTF